MQWRLDRRPTMVWEDYAVGEDSVTGRYGNATVTATTTVNGREQSIKGTVTNFGYRGDLTVKDGKVSFHYVG